MPEILKINGAEVKIGQDDGKVITVPLTALQYDHPKVGDEVRVYHDSDEYFVRLDRTASGATSHKPASDYDNLKSSTAEDDTADDDLESRRTINKHVFVWVMNLLFGGLGIDRFFRGQISLGVFKLLLCTFGWITIFGGLAGTAWKMVDWIIAMVKAYGEAYGSVENITFDEAGDYIN